MADEQSIFLRAIELPAGDERQRYLDDACGQDAPLRGRIEELLARHAEDSRFLEPLPRGMPATVAFDPAAEVPDPSTQVTFIGPVGVPEPVSEKVRPGSLVRYIGDYEILSEIARGGMGVVYKARQVRLKRIVALKMILSGEFASAADIRRFHTEAESAAKLDHPHIVPVYEVGEHQGVHYFSMGFVDGPAMSARIAEAPYAPREAAMIVRQLAGAVHYAHEHGVIHRDLKPANVLIDSTGQPRITDFGLAKQSKESSSLTGTGFVLGTPSYMPPEQATGRADLTREQADVYSLGAILYAALSGRPPFQADNALETLRQVVQQEPVSPRQLNPRIPVDLETICLKCLEKQIHRRYPSARELAEELDRFLNGQPILARPVRPTERLWKWCRRNPIVTALLATVAASLIIGTVVSTYFAIEADRRADENLTLAMKNRDLADKETQAKEAATASEQRALEQKRLALLEAANLALNEAETHCQRNEANVGLHWMVKAHDLAEQAGDADLADAARAMISGWLHQAPRLLAYPVDGGAVLSAMVAFGPEEKTLLVVNATSDKFGLQQFSMDTGERIDHITDVGSVGHTFAVSPDGARALLRDAESQPRIWSVTERKWLTEALELAGPDTTDAAFSPDGKLLATITNSAKVQIFDSSDGKLMVAFDHKQVYGNTSRRARLAFTADSKTLWTTNGGEALLASWDVSTGNEIYPSSPQHNWMPAIAISPSGQYMAVSANSAHTKLYSLTETPPRLVWQVKSDFCDSLIFSADSHWIIEGGRNGKIVFRSVVTGKVASSPIQLSTLQTGSLRFGRTRSLLAATPGGKAQVWELPETMRPPSTYANTAGLKRAVFAVNRRLQIGLTQDDHLVLQRTDRDEQVARLGPLSAAGYLLVIDAQERNVVCLRHDGHLATLNLDTHRLTISQDKLDGEKVVNLFALSPDGKTAVTFEEYVCRLWSLPEGRWVGEPLEIPPQKPYNFSPSHRFSADSSKYGFLDLEGRKYHLLDCVTGSETATIDLPDDGFAGIAALHPNGLYVARSRGNAIQVWDLSSRSVLREFGQHNSGVSRLIFIQDGQTLLTMAGNDAMRLWDWETGELIGSPMRGGGIVGGHDATNANNGRLLATNTIDEHLNVWHLRTGRRVAPQRDFGITGIRQVGFDEEGALANYAHNQRYLFPQVPEKTEDLRTFVEAWTGLALDGHDVRVLNRKEWIGRRERLQSVVLQ